MKGTAFAVPFFDLVLRFGALPAVRAFQKVDELLLRAGELLRFERDEVDRAPERAFVHLEGEQRAVLDLLLHGERREHGDAHAAGDHLFYVFYEKIFARNEP